MSNGFLNFAFIGPGGPEMLVVMLALLIMFGAKDAPRIFRRINEVLHQIRSTADNFKREVMYSDVNSDTESRDDTGEYDDYGLSAHHASEAGEADEPGAQPEPSEESAGTDEEGGDVPKA